jgi:hypothetical protein
MSLASISRQSDKSVLGHKGSKFVWYNGTKERAHNAAHWLEAYKEARPPVKLASRIFNTSPSSILKALAEIRQNDRPPLSVNDVAEWWATASEEDHATLAATVGVGSMWRAIERNLG